MYKKMAKNYMKQKNGKHKVKSPTKFDNDFAYLIPYLSLNIM